MARQVFEYRFDKDDTTMKLLEVIKRIVCLPRDFDNTEKKSIITLLGESGYLNLHTEVTVSEISNFLSKNEEYIKDWLEYSENKRCSSGWYFMNVGSGKFIVGFYPENANNQDLYDNPVTACAKFIKNELESLRELG